MDIEYSFTRNIPQNTEAEANVLKNLEGIVSKEAQLKTASFVDNPAEEVERIKKEEQERISTSIEQTEKTFAASVQNNTGDKE